MLKAEEALAISQKYTDDSMAGGGAAAGKNCTVDTITDITGGHRVTFKWTLDNGTVKTGTMDVMDGQDGQDGADGKGIKAIAVNASNHLIITYSDDTTTDAGAIEIASAVDSVNGKTGAVTLTASDVGAYSTGETDTALSGKVDKSGSKMLSDNNYSDADKTVVDGVTAALSNKVDKVTGKGLSTNDYTNADKTAVDGLTTSLNGKVDKETGKGLSEANYTEAEKTKLAGLSNYDDSTLSASVSANTAAIATLNGTGNGSVTKTVNDAIAGAQNLKKEVVQTVPSASSASANVLYLVPTATANVYEQWTLVEDNGTPSMIQLGTTDIDLSAYQTKNLSSAVGEAATVEGALSAHETALSNKVNAVSGKGLSTNDYTDTEKNKLAGLSNYDDTALAGRVSAIEGKIPANATTSNKLATADDIPDISGKVDKSSTAGLLKNDGTVNTTIEAAVSANTTAISNIKDGTGIDSFGDVETALANKADTSIVTGKADKVSGATNGNFAGVDANGNLTDSGKKAADFATQSDIEDIQAVISNKATIGRGLTAASIGLEGHTGYTVKEFLTAFKNAGYTAASFAWSHAACPYITDGTTTVQVGGSVVISVPYSTGERQDAIIMDCNATTMQYFIGYTTTSTGVIKKILISSDLTSSVTSGSDAPVTSGGVYNAIESNKYSYSASIAIGAGGVTSADLELPVSNAGYGGLGIIKAVGDSNIDKIWIGIVKLAQFGSYNKQVSIEQLASSGLTVTVKTTGTTDNPVLTISTGGSSRIYNNLSLHIYA